MNISYINKSNIYMVFLQVFEEVYMENPQLQQTGAKTPNLCSKLELFPMKKKKKNKIKKKEKVDRKKF
jgi:hypothetical protein